MKHNLFNIGIRHSLVVSQMLTAYSYILKFLNSCILGNSSQSKVCNEIKNAPLSGVTPGATPTPFIISHHKSPLAPLFVYVIYGQPFIRRSKHSGECVKTWFNSSLDYNIWRSLCSFSYSPPCS